MSRACCHHYPGGIPGCVSRSLHRRRRPSPLLWRVGSHIDCFEACSMFTHVAARTVRCPPEGVFSRSASGHSSPPDPPRVLPAGARVCRPGLSPGRAVHLVKAHTTTSPSVPCAVYARQKKLPLRRVRCRWRASSVNLHPRDDGKTQQSEPENLSQGYPGQDRRGAYHQPHRRTGALADDPGCHHLTALATSPINFERTPSVATEGVRSP
jgi:hypothetical protein